MIFGLGHSTFEFSDFVDICKTAEIDVIIDTRSHPGSSHSPQYNRSFLEEKLPENGIGYEWWPELGGWDVRHKLLVEDFKKYDVDLSFYVDGHFPKQRIAKTRKVKEGEYGFTNFGFHDYQFFMMLDEFLEGVDKLIAKRKSENIACICCEACWTKCHRSMIADYLAFKGEEFIHITPRFRKIKLPRTVVSLKRHYEVLGERALRYHEDVIKKWLAYKTE